MGIELAMAAAAFVVEILVVIVVGCVVLVVEEEVVVVEAVVLEAFVMTGILVVKEAREDVDRGVGDAGTHANFTKKGTSGAADVFEGIGAVNVLNGTADGVVTGEVASLTTSAAAAPDEVLLVCCLTRLSSPFKRGSSSKSPSASFSSSPEQATVLICSVSSSWEDALILGSEASAISLDRMRFIPEIIMVAGGHP